VPPNKTPIATAADGNAPQALVFDGVRSGKRQLYVGNGQDSAPMA
jgi:hypothetical protein